MANIIENIVTVLGEKQKVKDFIESFYANPFNSHFPIPEVLRKNVYVENSYYENYLKENYGITISMLYENDKLKKLLLKAISNSDIEIEQKIAENLCSGYYSWKEFTVKNWGITHEVFPQDIKVQDNTIIFETKWSSPKTFFEKVSQMIPLGFVIEAVEIGNLVSIEAGYKREKYFISC